MTLYAILHDLQYIVPLCSLSWHGRLLISLFFDLAWATSYFYMLSVFFDLVNWFDIRFRVEGLSGSSLSIPMDRGKVCLHPTLPRPYK
ncbi:hypothetical protein Hanom_Chr10g00896081 [Helianthus anomalus]